MGILVLLAKFRKILLKMPNCKLLVKFIMALPLLLVAACQPKTGTVLQVQLLWQGQPIDCQSSILLGGQPWQLQQLQFYLSGFYILRQFRYFVKVYT